MSGHAFVKPGQVAPDRPAPDQCMVCGQPQAAHDQRVAIARRTLDAYDAGQWTDPVNVTGHLAAAVRMLLEVTGGTTAAAPAGQAVLSPADVLTVLGALRDGARWNDYPPGDPALAARYRSLARSLGDDR